MNALYARQTLIKLFSSQHNLSQETSKTANDSTKKLPEVVLKTEQVGGLKLHELVSWSVLQEFSSKPFDGWIQALQCAIPVGAASATKSSTEAKQLSLNALVEEVSDQIILERLAQGDSTQSSSSMSS